MVRILRLKELERNLKVVVCLLLLFLWRLPFFTLHHELNNLLQTFPALLAMKDAVVAAILKK